MNKKIPTPLAILIIVLVIAAIIVVALWACPEEETVTPDITYCEKDTDCRSSCGCGCINKDEHCPNEELAECDGYPCKCVNSKCVEEETAAISFFCEEFPEIFESDARINTLNKVKDVNNKQLVRDFISNFLQGDLSDSEISYYFEDDSGGQLYAWYLKAYYESYWIGVRGMWFSEEVELPENYSSYSLNFIIYKGKDNPIDVNDIVHVAFSDIESRYPHPSEFTQEEALSELEKFWKSDISDYQLSLQETTDQTSAFIHEKEGLSVMVYNSFYLITIALDARICDKTK